MDELKLLQEPLFFEPNRVWRCYLGGKLLEEFAGAAAGADGNFPEDWLGSVTRADNGACQRSPDEGLSVIRGAGMTFAELLRRFPREALGVDDGSRATGVLCKLLDSAIRLPIQCHPGREFARVHFHSEHGKTESWFILATREIKGEKPYLLLGFKPGVTQAEFRRAAMAQDIPAMTACLHRVEAHAGDAYFIPGGLPHAIGPGLLLLEAQEPTDLVIQPERRIGDITLDDRQMWGGLSHDAAFSCFEYQGMTEEELTAKFKLSASIKKRWGNALLESVVDARRTDCFCVDKLAVTGEFELEYDSPWYLGVVTAGRGVVAGATERPLRRGDSFFVSNQIGKLRYRPTGEAPLELYLVRTPVEFSPE